MKHTLLLPVLFLLLLSAAHADKGPVIWHEGVQLSQESQKAIIMHNASEEVLILGTELKASRETEILEFIPFPAEPKVSLAKGNPFEEAAKLIDRKGIVFEMISPDFGKGGGEKATAPVEIRFSKKIGLHDVTVIKINDIGQFGDWLDRFFKGKGIHIGKEKLSGVYRNAQEYIGRGITYFAFDRVTVSDRVRFVEPLIYRFRTDRIYYPLKTSNLIGGRGDVELILLLPGSISDDIWQEVWKIFPRSDNLTLMLSSSSKVYRDEVTAIFPEPFFDGSTKIYLQVFKYSGPYDFKDDFTYGRGKLAPYAYRFTGPDPFLDVRFTPPLTDDERRDMREAFCLKASSEPDFVIPSSVLDCWNFIPREEYEVFSALFREGRLSGIPGRDAVIEKNTLRKEYRGAKIDQALVKDFNDKNKVSYLLENAFPDDGKTMPTIRNEEPGSSALGKGRTFLSRAAFNKDKTRALLYVRHVESRPRSLAGYFVILEKKGSDWKITDSQMAEGY